MGGTTICGYSSCNLNTGGIFDPKTNSWASINTYGAPEGRYFHSAVWTGSKMIVWGGTLSGSTTTNTGAIYDLKTNSWSSISTTNAPDARTGHAAVWTGTKMIIWGGWDSQGVSDLNSGGLYDPTSDTWSTTSLTNAPQARQLHSTVWTGSKMIVWGERGINLISGTNSGVAFSQNTGVFYVPKNDLWEALPTENSPSVRWGHYAAWTGTDLIVWGGGLATVGDATYLMMAANTLPNEGRGEKQLY